MFVGRTAQRLAATAALAPLAFLAAAVPVVASITTMLLTTGTPWERVDLALALRITLNAAGYLTLVAILSSALGFLIRKAVPAAAILLVQLLVVSPLLQGQTWYFLPDIASSTLWFATVPETAPAAAVAWLVLLGWTPRRPGALDHRSQKARHLSAGKPRCCGSARAADSQGDP